MFNFKTIGIVLATLLLFSGCSEKKPLLPPMSPVKLDSKSVSNMTKEEIQSLISKTMNQKVAAAGGSKYLVDPKHVAISVTGVNNGLADGKAVVWEKESYSWVYGYYYDANKSEILEVPASNCISSYLSGTSRKVYTFNMDCEEYTSLYNPGQDFKNQVLMFRTYLLSEFPNFIADYNSKKIK